MKKTGGHNGEILLYETEDGRTRVECRFSDETLWMSQSLMADLFQTPPQNITLHLKALYQEGEIVESATCKGYLQVRTEGAREVRGACSRRKSSANGLQPGGAHSLRCRGNATA